jgi:hypothetical protein
MIFIVATIIITGVFLFTSHVGVSGGIFDFYIMMITEFMLAIIFAIVLITIGAREIVIVGSIGYAILISMNFKIFHAIQLNSKQNDKQS